MAIHTPRDKSAKHPHNSQLVSTKISALSFPKTTNFNIFTCGNFHVNNFHSTTYIVNIPCVYYHGIRKANHAGTENCEVKDTRNRKNRDKKKKDIVTQQTSSNSLRATSTSFSFALFSFPLFLRSCFASAPLFHLLFLCPIYSGRREPVTRRSVFFKRHSSYGQNSICLSSWGNEEPSLETRDSIDNAK